MVEAVLDDKPHAFPRPDFFPHSFIDDNVRVDRHSEGQNDTGDAGECENGSDGGQNADKEKYVGEEGDISNVAGSVIIERHVEKYPDEGDDEGDHTCIDGFLSE